MIYTVKLYSFSLHQRKVQEITWFRLVSQLIKIEAIQEKHQLELHTHVFLGENAFRDENVFRAEQKIRTRSMFGLIKMF